MSISIAWILIFFGIWKIGEIAIKIANEALEHHIEVEEKNKKFMFINDRK